jgi:hypothetical protein
LFEPLSNHRPRHLALFVQDEILKWNYKLGLGIERLAVRSVVREEATENGIDIEIQFVAQGESDVNVLTFGYWEYLDTLKRFEGTVSTFVRTVRLNPLGNQVVDVGTRYPSRFWN